MTLGQEAMARLGALLDRFGQGRVEVDASHGMMKVRPAQGDGFEVALYDEGDTAMVAAERWHAHYDDPDQAAWGAYWLLTPYYRIVHELKGGVLVAVWIEAYGADGWEPSDPVFFLNPETPVEWLPIGDERYMRRYWQTDALPSPVTFEQVAPNAKLDAHGFPVDFHLGKRLEEAGVALAPTLF